MGYIFEVSDFTVWEPSLDTGRLFLAGVRQFERQLNMPSGLVEEMSDTIEINPKLLLEFVQALLHSINQSNESFLLLVHGPVIHLLALLHSVMPSVRVSNVPDRWADEATALLRHRFRVNETIQEDHA